MADEITSAPSQGLSVFQSINVPQKHDDKVFNELAKAGEWLPRIQLFGGNSKEVKRGTFAMGHYGLVRSKDSIEDIGAQFDCVVCAWHPKAMRIIQGESIDNYYDPTKAEFHKIVADSEIEDSGCMYGPEFLVWLPQQSLFALFYFSNKTMRRESPNMRQLLLKAATVKAHLIETKKYSWHGPVVLACTTPITNEPAIEELTKVVTTFTNSKDSEAETVSPTDQSNARAR